MKQKRCRNCREHFQPFNSFDKFCSKACEFADSEYKRLQMMQKAKREERKADAVKKAALRPGYLEGKAQDAINAYVRVRDHGEGCISCDRPANWHGQWQAGHLKTRGANSFLRYSLWNLNKQCSVCNNHHSGNVAEHERGIALRYGQERLDYLHNAPRSRRYSDEYLIRLAAIFRKKTRIMKKRKGL